MLKPPEPPKEPVKRPGTGFFLVIALFAAIAMAIVWAFNAH